jgi:hypothetical protein
MPVPREPRAAWLTRLETGTPLQRTIAPFLLIVIGLACVVIWLGIVTLAVWITAGSAWLWPGVLIASAAAWAIYGALVEGRSFKELMSGLAAGVGALGGLAVVVGLIGGVIFLFLGLRQQREIYFKLSSHPSIPEGIYAPVRIVSNTFERRSLNPDVYVLTFEGDGDILVMHEDLLRDPKQMDGIVGLLREDNHRFTAECEPRFWNHCDSLLPGRLYCGKWVSPDRQQIAVGPAEGTERCRAARSETAIYTLRGWTDRTGLTR